MSLLTLHKVIQDEESCLKLLAEKRWENGRYCPHCGSLKTYEFSDGKLFKCADCRKKFTALVGTIFQGSHIPLSKWFYATYLITAHKKGVSSAQIAKDLEITQKSAWFMLQRIRHSLARGSTDKPIDGPAQGDETYNGGRQLGHKGMYKNKMAVIGIVESKKGSGQFIGVATKHVDSTVAHNLLSTGLVPGSVFHTDESLIYRRVGLTYQHDVVNHKLHEYARGSVTTNQIEGVWQHLKASLNTIYMFVSQKHLQMYVNEFSYRYSTRDMDDYSRFEAWIGRVSGKRLTYLQLIKPAPLAYNYIRHNK